ncbi:MAG: DUF4276 family protein [Pirellulales bacterium]|nr:DUF4276 family protein [Pirellulales bacterium]
MKELVFLLEERSIQEVLKVVVPPLLPDNIVCRFVPHEGKNDLEKSIPRKLRAWQGGNVWFVVVRDKNSSDCKAVKRKLLKLCEQGRCSETLVRIVCHHLESWFLGDLAAVEKAFNLRGIAKRHSKRKFSAPDRLANAEQELRRLAPMYQKIGGSRLIAPHMNIEKNTSHSLKVLISGIHRLAGGELMTP